MAKKYPVLPPPTAGARNPHAAAIVALEVGGDPYVARVRDRNRIAPLMSYWARKLGRRFTARKMDSDLVVWRIA